MYGLISPKGRIAALCSGNEASLYGMDGALLGVKNLVDVQVLFRRFDDTTKLPKTSNQGLIKSLNSEYKKQEAVQLFLTIIDNDIDSLNKLEVSVFLEDLLCEQYIADYLGGCMSAIPLPYEVIFSAEFSKKLQEFPKVFLFLNTLLENQEKISVVYTKWGKNVLEHVSTENHAFLNGLYAGSGFTYQYLKGLSSNAVNGYKFDFYAKSNKVPNSRDAISNFFKGLELNQAASKKIVPMKPEIEEFSTDEYKKPTGNVYQKYTQVTAQLSKIKELLAANDIAKAKLFASSLIEQQVNNNDFEYAAKSLGSLSEFAKSYHLYELMVDWAIQATEVCPSDNRGWAQLGDAYLLVDDYESARRVYEKCADLAGLKGYSLAGFARIYRSMHDYETALSFIEKAWECEQDPVHGAIGAEILGDLGRYNDAESLYRELVKRCPDEIALRCGLAATLAQQHKFDEAKKIYKDAIKLWPTDQFPHTSLGFLLARQGQFKDAFKYLDNGIKFSNSSDFIPVNAKANALRMAGKYNEAESLLSEMIQKHSACIEFKFGLLDVLIARGDLKRANELCLSYFEGVSDRERDSLLRIQANILRKQGSFDLSMGIIDKLCQKHPKWILALCDKADLLRNMGVFDSSRVFYNLVLSIHNGYRRAINGLRLIDALSKTEVNDVQNNKDLPTATIEDWEDINIEGLVLLAQKKYVSAQSVLGACKKSPFKPIIDAAIVPQVIAYVGMEQYQKGLKKINALTSTDAKIQKAIIYCQLGDFARAKELISKIELMDKSFSHVIKMIEEKYLSNSPASNDSVYDVLEEHITCMLRVA